ncbi:hypothetical protein BVRB_3g056860 isoform B [Beta vulgaris subsp. vulgaris]|nr:hypothetical protein BVRB_3g056860 isoform B [Beta vulgaris subsp. vulgaris]
MAEDFFIVLYNILKGRPEVSDIHCVNDAKVPLMRFKFEGVAVDFPYAQFQVMSVPENFQSLLRCIKFWAKRRGVYGNTLEDVPERRSLMPIGLPCSPYQYCQSNITRSTFNRIRAECLRGQNIVKEILSPDSNWDNLFEPYGNAYRKSRFLKIYLVACAIDELGRLGWMGEVTISLSHFEDK